MVKMIELPYTLNALEPYYSKETLDIHYNILYKGYVDNTNKTEEKLAIECSNKEKLEVAFSSRYMLEALKVIKDDNILLLINSDDKPILIKSVKDETLLELILPVKTY